VGFRAKPWSKIIFVDSERSKSHMKHIIHEIFQVIMLTVLTYNNYYFMLMVQRAVFLANFGVGSTLPWLSLTWTQRILVYGPMRRLCGQSYVLYLTTAA